MGLKKKYLMIILTSLLILGGCGQTITPPPSPTPVIIEPVTAPSPSPTPIIEPVIEPLPEPEVKPVVEPVIVVKPKPIIKEKPMLTEYKVDLHIWDRDSNTLEMLFIYLDQNGNKMHWPDIGGEHLSIHIKSGDKVFWGKDDGKITGSYYLPTRKIDQSIVDYDDITLEATLIARDGTFTFRNPVDKGILIWQR